MKDNEKNEFEYKKMIIDIPKNTRAVSVVTIANVKNPLQQVMSTRIYSTEEVEERIIKGE